MTKDEALKTALDWYRSGHEDIAEFQAMIESILEHPEQEPVGTVKELLTQAALERLDLRGSTKLYTALPKRPWVALTDEQIWQLVDGTKGSVTAFARALEAKLKENNA